MKKIMRLLKFNKKELEHTFDYYSICSHFLLDKMRKKIFISREV